MDIRFSDYRFIKAQKTLYFKDELIPLKSKQAQLLEFFLCNADAVHSKSVIMDNVWEGKVVSEQVVFQTISQLRAIFGADSIKTFSKTGYKWQMPVQLCNGVAEPAGQSPSTDAPSSPINRLYVWLLGFILVAICALYLFNSAPQKPVIYLNESHRAAHQQSSDALNYLNLQGLEDQSFVVETIDSDFTLAQTFSSPFFVKKQSNIPDSAWMLWYENHEINNKQVIDFGLAKEGSYWRGVVTGIDQSSALEKLKAQVNILTQYTPLQPKAKQFEQSQLLQLLKSDPNNLDILMAMAQRSYGVNQYDLALTYAQKVLAQRSDDVADSYAIEAQILMGRVYRRLNNDDLAEAMHIKAERSLENFQLPRLHQELTEAKAWFAQEQKNYPLMYDGLDKGIEYASQNNQSLALFELHILTSILAKKAGDNDKKFEHLNIAQSILLSKNLSESNLAVVYYHFAIFADDPKQAKPYLEKIVEIPKTERNFWILNHATELLVEQYLGAEQEALALSLLQKMEESPNQLVLLAKVYEHQDKPEQARGSYLKAFELARLKHNSHIASHAALSLYKLSDVGSSEQYAYLEYLKRNANPVWLESELEQSIQLTNQSMLAE